MAKFKVRYFKPAGFKSFEGHWLQDIVWPMQGSKGNSYEVKLHDKGFDCTCPGFTFRGECKHVKEVARRAFAEYVPQYRWY